MAHSDSQKAYKGMGMEGFTARWYASLTFKAIDDFKALAWRVAGGLPPGSRVLEVAPGPGYFAIELAKLGGYPVTGLDISRTFVEIARQNAARAGVNVDFREGNAADMPFEGRSFDYVLCRAAFKNFAQPVRAIEEMYRVLRPNGHALIIDLRRDASPESVRIAVEQMGLGRVNTLITKLTFRFMLLKRAYTRREFEQFVTRTKFESAEFHEDRTSLEVLLSRSQAYS